MTIIKFLVIIRACGEIEPCISVAYFFIMFPTVVSSVHPSLERHIFIHSMNIIGIIRSKETWRIISGGESNTIISRGKRDGSWDQIWCSLGSFMRDRSIVNGDGR